MRTVTGEETGRYGVFTPYGKPERPAIFGCGTGASQNLVRRDENEEEAGPPSDRPFSSWLRTGALSQATPSALVNFRGLRGLLVFGPFFAHRFLAGFDGRGQFRFLALDEIRSIIKSL